MSELPQVCLDLIRKLDDVFWDTWKEKTNNFPDTDDGTYYKHLTCESGMMTIIMNFFLGYPKQKRTQYLEEFIQKLRTFESSCRDMGIEESE